MNPSTLSPLAQGIQALCLSVWALIHPMAPKAGDAPAVARAIAIVVEQDGPNAPVYGSHAEDAAVMAYYALRESSLDNRAVGDGGRSYGIWQQQGTVGRGSIVSQARAWLALLHTGATVCRDDARGVPAPASTIVWGSCHAADSLTKRDVAELAAKRERRAHALMERAFAPWIM